jgi:hypothetical protein
MERREFLTLLGVGAAAIGASLVTMTPARARPALAEPAAGAAPGAMDDFMKELAEANGGDARFAQFYYYRRPRRFYRPYYYRPWRRPWGRRCWWRRTPWGWRRFCRW